MADFVGVAGFVGEAVLSGFIQKLVDMVTSPELWKYARKEQVVSELNKWKIILLKIHAVLHDAEEKQMTNSLVKMWLDELRDLAYDVEDILDDFATEALRSSLMMAQPQPRTSMFGRIFSYIFSSASTSNFSMGSKIEEITARLQGISAQTKDLDLREIAAGWSDRKRKRAQILPTTSLVVESRIYGRETDKAAIVDMLLKDDPNSDDEVSVIPIVGMGGIGKTTLAQLAFNDDKVKGHFDPKVWVCVSDDFDVLRITKTILQSVDPVTPDVNDLNLLQGKLEEKFSGKMFLVVLDDVWNNKCAKWDTLCEPMRAGARGSKLIVTTRNQGVVAVTRTSTPAYHLRELSHDHCLSLFTQQALRTKIFDDHPDLKEVGVRIVRRCKGSPLAAKALGGILRNQLNLHAWENILTSKIMDLDEDKTDILPALMLSYHHLPSHLKRCFAYCSIFPKDYEFKKDELVLLWMAEGFLQQRKGTRPEDLGSEYFDELFFRSFFQNSSRYLSRFVMHDLTNDLAQSVAGEICYHLDSASENSKQSTISEKARHSSFNSQLDADDNRRKLESLQKAKCLRTLVALPIQGRYEQSSTTSKVLDDLLKEVKCLRVLSLDDCGMKQLPDSIGSLKHLRYLNLSRTSIIRLPDSLGDLYNLQALLLSFCHDLDMLPTGIGNLINLRHLDISHTEKLQEMPSQIGDLTNLQTLSKFVVGQGSCLGIRELKNLPELQGKLSILGLHNVLDVRDGRDANLGSKHRIEELTMEWSSNFDGSRNERHERHVLEQLRPHGNLKKLTVESYGGSDFPRWMKNPFFPLMTYLILQDCKRCTSLPALGQLSSLKVLHIKGMSKVESIDEKFFGGIGKPFPSLEVLEFEDMPEWEDWICPDAVEEAELFPCLTKLTIRKCHKLGQQLPIPGIFECPSLGVSFSRFASLGEVCLEECNVMEFMSIEIDSGLQTVVIGPCDWLVSFEEQKLPCNLKILTIEYCDDLEKLPNGWQTLTCLEKLKIKGCPKLESFPETGLPPMLRHLVVSDCESLKWLPHNYNSCALESLKIKLCPSLACFPSGELPTTLKELYIKYCENLESLPEGMMHHNSTCCLQVLSITDCPSLKSFPTGQLPSTLMELGIWNCPNLELMLENMFPNNTALERLYLGRYPNLRTLPECFHGLKELHIKFCEGLVCFPARGLSTPNLTKLDISLCQNLESLPHQMKNLKSLRYLTIWGCPGVESFPEGGLAPNLTSLEVGQCENLRTPVSEWGLHTLTSLSELYIYDTFPDMVSFPDEECLPPISLTSLQIHRMKSLAFLALPNPSSLRYLKISSCPNLSALGPLPATLKSLDISGCPIIKERYLKDTGEYWPEIAHVPCTQIY